MIDPASTLHSRFVSAIQNAPYTHVFCLAFLALTLLSGCIVPLACAFLLALLASFVYQLAVLAPRAVPGQLAVLITGAGTGLGFDMAVRLAGLGVTVYAGVREAAEGRRLVEAAGRAGGGSGGGGGGSAGSIVSMVLDVTKQQHIDAAQAAISRQVDAGKLQSVRRGCRTRAMALMLPSSCCRSTGCALSSRSTRWPWCASHTPSCRCCDLAPARRRRLASWSRRQ